jgi:1-acyl-sn-glycerol-3-phosphate acyltransferase
MLGRRWSPHVAGVAIRASIKPPVALSGEKHLPIQGPYIVVANHLNGPGVWVGLPAALIAASIGDRSPTAPIRVVGVAAYRDFQVLQVPISPAITELVFKRFYNVFGIIRMPHITEGATRRSGAVRQILAALRAGDVVILFPEGRNVHNFVMRRFQPGVGDLIRLAAKSGVPVIPAAIAPRHGSFTVSFLPAFEVSGNANGKHIEQSLGMTVAAHLPAVLRGPFAESVNGDAD